MAFTENNIDYDKFYILEDKSQYTSVTFETDDCKTAVFGIISDDPSHHYNCAYIDLTVEDIDKFIEMFQKIKEKLL